MEDSWKSNWKEVVTDLYRKIDPVGGQIHHFLSRDLHRPNFSIGFYLKNFTYKDPFYGEMEEKDKFQMNFGIENYQFHSIGLRVRSIQDIENKRLEWNGEIEGAFSNSLAISIQWCEFGKINNQAISFTMCYVLTNTDSYGLMTGSYDDHKTIEGKLSTNLKVEDLSITSGKPILKKIRDQTDSTVYDLDLLKTFEGINHNDSKYYTYKVPVK